jgi:hypothetical protein
MALYRDGVAVASRSDLARVPMTAVPDARFELGHNIVIDTYRRGSRADDLPVIVQVARGAGPPTGGLAAGSARR